MSLAVLGTLTAAGGKTFAAFFLGSGVGGGVSSESKTLTLKYN